MRSERKKARDQVAFGFQPESEACTTHVSARLVAQCMWVLQSAVAWLRYQSVNRELKVVTFARSRVKRPVN